MGAFLTALRMRGESETELLGAATAMQNIARRFQIPELQLLDTCGTGGDGSSSLNISTMASLVCAALGVSVAKHGNRSVSSRCGSADILEALGVPLESDPETARERISKLGYAFLFAPQFHPHVAQVASVRKQLGIRTLFNLLGPLLNPAGANFQLLGVYEPTWMSAMARTSVQLGCQRCLCVHGAGGWDELTPWGNNLFVFCERSTELCEWSWDLRELGLPAVSPDDVRGGDANENLGATWQILRGQDHPGRVLVCLNAAAGLLLARQPSELREASAWKEAYASCCQALDSGKVANLIESLRLETL